MRYRKQSTSGDYTFGNSKLDFYIDEPLTVGQAVKTRLQLWEGEWFLDIEEGTPWLIGVLGKKTKDVADATIQDRILGTEGLVQLNNYESQINPINRVMTVSGDVDTIFGPTQLDIENRVNF